MVGGLLASSMAAASGQAAPAPIQNTEQSASVHGVVLNGGTNRPLARALVQVEARSVLTGSDGRFEFTGLSGTTATVTVRKPGFYVGSDPYESATAFVKVGSTDDVEVRLSPEALLTGTVTAPNGDPLAQVQIQALRLMSNEPGSRWTMAGQSVTNAEGQFRLPLPGGEYVVETQYMPERPGSHGAMLPVMVPASTSSNGGNSGAATLRLASGSEQHLDLHPPVRPSHAVHVQIDSLAGGAGGQFAPQIQVHLANGLVFSAQSRGAEKQGETVLNLPNGSYLLSANTGGREDGASYGETRVTVADEDVTGVTIHLQKALEVPIEVSIDPAASASPASVATTTFTASSSAVDPAISATYNPGSASFIQQLGLFLQQTNAGVSLRTENVSPVSRRGGGVGLTVSPGSYRLRTSGYSPWFVESATVGGTDLLAQDLVVDDGSSPVPLRVVVSNRTATVKGTAKLKERPGRFFVYLIATAPSASGLITVVSATDGSFSHGQIPPGSYIVVAFESRPSLNLTDPAVQRQLASYVKTVTVAPDETASVDLDSVPASELKP